MKTQFKVGDKVTVTSWYFSDDICLPQNATIIRILAGGEPYQLELEDYHKGKKQWWFREGEFELTNNMSVKGKTFIYRGDRHDGFTNGKEYICQTDGLNDWSAFINNSGRPDGWPGRNDTKFTLKEESKKILGYKFKEGFKSMHKAASEIASIPFIGSGPFKLDFYEHGELKQAGVLDLWFEPVYEEEKPKYIDYFVVHAIGASSFSVIVYKDKISFNDIDIPIDHLKRILVEETALGPWSVDYSYVSIGCKKDIHVTEIKKIIRLSETL